MNGPNGKPQIMKSTCGASTPREASSADGNGRKQSMEQRKWIGKVREEMGRSEMR